MSMHSHCQHRITEDKNWICSECHNQQLDSQKERIAALEAENASNQQIITDIFYALNPHKRGLDGQTIAPTTLAGHAEYLVNQVTRLQADLSAHKLSNPLSCEGIGMLLDQVKEVQAENAKLRLDLETSENKLLKAQITAKDGFERVANLHNKNLKLRAFAQEAKCWRACVEYGWHIRYWESIGSWQVWSYQTRTPVLVGSSKTPEDAVEDALTKLPTIFDARLTGTAPQPATGCSRPGSEGYAESAGQADGERA